MEGGIIIRPKYNNDVPFAMVPTDLGCEWVINVTLTGTLQQHAKPPRWPMSGVTLSPVSVQPQKANGLHQGVRMRRSVVS